MAGSRADRRTWEERRRIPRVTRCSQCHAHLVVDRRGPTVMLHSAATYIPAAARSSSQSSDAPPRCPVCSAALRHP